MDAMQMALKYLPCFFQNEKEPFPIRRIGYHIFLESGPSPSFRRTVKFEETTAFVIEYAIFWDYDIQHLYDLEHVWIYVGQDGQILQAEGSAHGWFLNMDRLGGRPLEQTHMPIYLQPGKHAMMPYGDFSRIYPDYLIACDGEAGKMGMLVTDIFKGKIEKAPGMDARVEKYILENYRFIPSLRFIPSEVADEQVVPLEELLNWIPGRLATVIQSEILPWEEQK